jgi:dolichol-phosphate mannosyltransferase
MSTTHEPPRRMIVIIPTYNERENLELIVDRIHAVVPDASVLVVDDNSPDGTGEIADRLAADDARIHVLHRPGKSGLGAAYLAGFSWGLRHGYEALVEMDADGSHDPAYLPALLAGLKDADLVLGSRWVRGGRVLNWPKHREILSRGGNAYVRLMLGLRIRDATGGYRAFRAGTLRAIDLASVESTGYCFQIDLTVRAVRAGLTVAEVPITFTERARGTSKMSQAIVIEALWRVTQWRFSRGRRGDTQGGHSAVHQRGALETAAAARPSEEG